MMRNERSCGHGLAQRCSHGATIRCVDRAKGNLEVTLHLQGRRTL